MIELKCIFIFIATPKKTKEKVPKKMRNRHFKRLTSLLLVVVMLASMLPALPITVNAADSSTKFTFSSFTAGTQYAKDEVHKLDDNFTMVTTESHFTSELRIYSSSTHNGYAILKCTSDNVSITGLGMNAGNNVDTLSIYGSNDDGANWTQIGEVSVTSTSYKDYSITFPNAYKWIKLDVKGSNQVRLKSITVSYEISEPETPACNHANKVAIGEAKEPTCTASGNTAGEQCKDCGAVTTAQETIPATGHKYDANGICEYCKEEKPATENIELVFDANKANRTEYSTQKQVWAKDGVTFTNNKSSSTTNVADYGAPVRLYANSEIILEAPANHVIHSIAFTANTTAYATELKNSIGSEASANGTTVTVTLSTPASSFTIAKLTAQVRLDSVTVTVSCKHANKSTTTVDATCEENGSITVTCNDCGRTISTETITSSGHTEVILVAVEATCKSTGLTEGKKCSKCGEVLKEQTVLLVLEHTDTTGDNLCDNLCGNEICGALVECIHQLDEGTITKYPTCSELGIKEYKCIKLNCTHVEVEELEIDPSNHTEEDIPGKAATCTEDGLTDGKKCSECGEITLEQETISAINHENAYAVSGKDPTCTEPGLTAGVYCPDCETYPTPQEETSATGHNYTEGACSSCGKAKPLPSGYFLVTDASTLKVGDKIVIVAKDYDFALSTEQKSNNRGQIEITKNDNSITINETVQIITLEAGTVDGTFAFNTGSGYLYAASSNDNYLRTQTTNNANGSWKIEIDANGVATIKAQGTNTRNWLRYNPNNSIFSCYASGQKDIVIYKLEEAPKLSGYSVTLNKGVTVNLTYNVPDSWIAANKGAYVTFNGEKTELVAGANKFTTTLTPKKVNEDLFFTLHTADGTVVTKHNVGVATYKSTVESLTASQLGMSDAKYTALTALLNKVVVYGKAATDDLENNLDVETFDGVDDWNGADDTYDVFNGISAELSEQADMYITINKEKVDLDYTITITRGNTTLASGDIGEFITKDGYIVIAGLYPADFNKEITITVSNESDEVIAQASFTFNEYLKALYNSISDTYFKNMIAATYQYGVAVDTYVKA